MRRARKWPLEAPSRLLALSCNAPAGRTHGESIERSTWSRLKIPQTGVRIRYEHLSNTGRDVCRCCMRCLRKSSGQDATPRTRMAIVGTQGTSLACICKGSTPHCLHPLLEVRPRPLRVALSSQEQSRSTLTLRSAASKKKETCARSCEGGE